MNIKHALKTFKASHISCVELSNV